MDEGTGTYAPQSPDLSGFFDTTKKSQQPYHSNPNLISNSYAPRSPSLNHDPQSQSQSQSQFNYPNNPLQNHNHYAYQQHDQTAFVADNYEYNNIPIPDLPQAHRSFSNHNKPSPSATAYHPLQQSASYTPPQFKPEPSYEQDYLLPQTQPLPLPPNMSSRGPRIKSDSSLAQPTNYKDPNPNNIEIKTKFPVARIKRIMQADEEVGKVAQVTPVAVSKALELFMIALVGGAAEIAKEKGQKRVTAQHLKAVVLGSDQFDFLTEIVGRVNDVQEGAGGEGKKRKEKAQAADSESSEEEKKPKKGRGRRKKNED